MNRRLAVPGLVLLATFGTRPSMLHSQGTQGAAHLEHQRAGLARDSLVLLHNRVIAYLAEREAFEQAVASRNERDDGAYRRRALRVLELGRELRRMSLEERGYREALRNFADEARALDSLTPQPGTRAAFARHDVGVTALALTPPFPGALSPNVAFTLGIVSPPCSRCGAGVELGTNLAGAALGAAVGALGAPAGLKEYFEKNIALGLTLGTRKTSRITSAVSVGLGSVDVLSRALWPMLGVEQFDSSDARLPADVRARDPAQGTWSVPQLGVGLTWYSKAEVKKRLQENKPVPILSLGVRLPQYYPGSASAALGALFNGNEHKYAGVGSARIFASLTIPLFRVDGS